MCYICFTKTTLQDVFYLSPLVYNSSLDKYIYMILKKHSITYLQLCHALYYIRKIRSFIEKHHKLVKEIFLIAIILSCKYTMDSPYKNSLWAKSMKMDLKDINSIELSFLIFIKYDLFVHEEYMRYWLTFIDNKTHKLINYPDCKVNYN